MHRLTTSLLILAIMAIFLFGCGDDQNMTSYQLEGQSLNLAVTAPADGVFESATLHVFVASASDQPVNVHRITEDWDEATVTFNTFGGAFAAGVEGSFVADAIEWKTVDVSSLVAGWMVGDFDNFGLLLDQVDMATPRTGYNSKENDWFPPFIEICWTTPGGTVCQTLADIGDSYIWPVLPDENNGDAVNLFTGWGYSTDLEKQTLIRFELPEMPPEDDCGDCEGKITQLTLQYIGDIDASTIVVTQKGKKHEPGDVVFDDTVEPGEQFTFIGTDKHGTLGTEITITINGGDATKIHTSCSQPIGPGLIKGDFLVIEGYSRYGGLLCPVTDDEEPDGNCEGKVTELTLEYTGDMEDAPVVVTQKKKKKHGGGEVVFDGILQPGEQFTFVGTDKKGTLGTEITITVNDGDKTKIHTSCSKPIGPGLVRGDFTVIEGYSRNGGLLDPVAPDAQD